MSENQEFGTEKYANVELSEQEQQMQKFLEEAYGLTRDEYVSIVLWLDNFSLKFDNIQRFEQVEDSLSKDFGLTPNDIYGILFSHGDVFCNDYSKTLGNFETLNARYGLSKKDFAGMLKVGCVIDGQVAKDYEVGLRTIFPGKKWIPMSKILKNTIEYANVDYAEDAVYKIRLLEKFGLTLEDIGDKFDFLKFSSADLLTRLKLMSLTNELPHSFLSVGHLRSNPSVYKLFLKFQADREFKDRGYKGYYSEMKKKAESFDDNQPLSEEDIKDIDAKFAEKFKKLDNAISLVKPPEPKTAIVANVQVEPEVIPVMTQAQSTKVDAVESGVQISYTKNPDIQVKKSTSSSEIATANGGSAFVQIDPSHKYIWTYMVKNFGLTYQEYPDVLRKINPDKRNRLQQQATDIEAVFEDVKKDFHISRRDFGQFFKYTLYGMEQRLALLGCFGISPDDLTSNGYINAPILGLHYDQLEYMLKVASLGKVELDKNLGRIAKFNRDTFLAKYIKYVESGENCNMLDTLLTESDYRDIIMKKVPAYRKDKVIEKKYAETYPVSNSFLEGYNEHQRNLLMMVGLLIKKYGMSYVDAKQVVQESKENFNIHSKLIEERITALNEIGFDSMNVIYNSGILRLPDEKAIPRAIIAKYLGVDEETFLKRYVSTSEARVFARMMGAMDIKPSYYYSSEKVFSGQTGLSTEELMKQFVIDSDALYRLKRKIYETEKMAQIDRILSTVSRVEILDENKIPLANHPEENELRDYLMKKYGIDVFAFQTARNSLGAQGLQFLTRPQFERAIEIFRSDLKLTDEDVSAFIRDNPKLFSNGFKPFIERYSYFEDKFSASRYTYKKLLLSGDESVIMRDGLAEDYARTSPKIKRDFDVDISKQDFLNILRNLQGSEKLHIPSQICNSFTMLKNYNIEPSEIKCRYDFIGLGIKDLELRLMLFHLLGETPDNFFGSSCYININLLAARYMLYKEGKIPKSAILLKRADFEKQTGIKLETPANTTAINKVQIAKDFTKVADSVSFAMSQDMYVNKLKTKQKGEVVIRNSDYLSYMFSEVLGVDFKTATIAKRRNIGLDEIYARFMGREDLQCDSTQYYLDEYAWKNLTKTPTFKLVEQFPLTNEVIDMIINYYLALHPEDEFNRPVNKKKEEPKTEEKSAGDKLEKISE